MIEPLQSQHVRGVLTVLTGAFGAGFDEGWFEWKHTGGPWGASPGWVAVDESGVVGVRLFLPWAFQAADSRSLEALRPCDTATAPRARERGVFTSLTRTALESTSNRCDLFYNTPNEQSRGGYFKMGFTEWLSVSQEVGLVTRRPARLIDDPDPEAATASLGGVLRTRMDRRFVNWRYANCPFYRYQTAGLSASDSANGVVYRRRKWHRLPLIVVAELWGKKADRAALLSAVGAKERCSLFWVTTDQTDAVGPSFGRKATLVTHLVTSGSFLTTPVLSVGDLEDVL